MDAESARDYLERVRAAFIDDPERYNTFLDVMREFQGMGQSEEQRAAATVRVIARVRALFKGHRSLLLGFNGFLPQGYHFEVPEEEAGEAGAAAAAEAEAKAGGEGEAAPAQLGGARGGGGKGDDYQRAIEFVTRVKTRFRGEGVYRTFLKILDKYKQQASQGGSRRRRARLLDVTDQIYALFSEHPDLCVGFIFFLPDDVQELARERINDRLAGTVPDEGGDQDADADEDEGEGTG